jgi:hypothetical protein
MAGPRRRLPADAVFGRYRVRPRSAAIAGLLPAVRRRAKLPGTTSGDVS